MQEHADATHNGICARPASGSAFLAGHIVTMTIPTLAMGSRLLAIGDDWTELRNASEDDHERQDGGLLSAEVHPDEPIGGRRPRSTPPSRR